MGSAGSYMVFVITESRQFGQFVGSIIDSDIETIADRGSSVVLMRPMAFGMNIGRFASFAEEFLHQFDCSFDRIAMRS